MKLKRFLKTFGLLLAAFLVVPLKPAYAATCTLADPPKLEELTCLFGNIVASLEAIGAIAAFLIIVVGAFKYMSSHGDPKALDSAKSTITWGIVGFVLVFLTYFIMLFVSNLLGVNVFLFTIPSPT